METKTIEPAPTRVIDATDIEQVRALIFDHDDANLGAAVHHVLPKEVDWEEIEEADLQERDRFDARYGG